jgi:predicted permease
MVRSLIRLQEADKGFRPDHVLTMRVPIGTLTQRPAGKYGTRVQQTAYYGELLGRLQTIPGVSDAALVNNLPLSRVSTTVTFPGPVAPSSTRTISPRYFAALGIPLLSGRLFSDADHAGSPRVAIINEYLARELYPGRDPLGQILPSTDPKTKTSVVGVVKDSWQRRHDEPVKGELYLPFRQTLFGVALSTFVVRTTGDPLLLAGALRQQVWAVDPDQPVLKVETMNDVVANSIWRPRFSAWIFSMLGGLALLLTAIGVYAVVAYTTALRMREVGIRIALGAGPGKVVNVVLRDAMMPLAAGLAAGLGAALLLSHLLASLLYETRSTDPVAYLGAGVLLLGIGVFAGARPAWKAATCEPLSVLRAE